MDLTIECNSISGCGHSGTLQTLAGERLATLSTGLDDSHAAAQAQLARALEAVSRMRGVVEGQRETAGKLVDELSATDEAGAARLAEVLREQSAGAESVCRESAKAVEGALDSLVAG